MPKLSESGFIKLLTCVIIFFLVLLLILAGGFLLYKKKTPLLQQFTNKQGTQQKANTKRLTGNAGETYPYGNIKEETITSDLFDDEGGVLTAYLSNNIRAYLIVPPGYSGYGGDVYKLTPYFSMPTSKKAPALPTDLGYGVDFEIENTHSDNIEPLYLVFDLDQGKTVAQIANDQKIKNYCLPTLPTFNATGCALLNKVPLSDHTNTKYGVVSPVRDADYTNLMFMNSTIPIGFDNLVVVQITKQATFIPIVLSQDVLTDVVKADKPGFTIPLIEGLVHAVNNNISYDDSEVYYNLNKALFSGGDPIDSEKVLQILPKYKEYLSKMKALIGSKNKDTTDDTSLNYLDLQIGDYNTLEKETTDDMTAAFIRNGEISSSRAYSTLFSMFQLRRLEKEGFAQAKQLRDQMTNKIVEDVNYYIDPENERSANDFLMFESAIWGKPEYFSTTRLADNSNQGLFKIAYANTTLPSDAPSTWDTFMNNLAKILEDMWNNPCNFSIGKLIRAMGSAQLIGDDATAAQMMSIMRQRLLDDMRKSADLGKCAQAQGLGLDHDYACVENFCNDQAQIRIKRIECTTLMDKNLKNFGMNEVTCKEVTPPPDKTPKLPPDCGAKEPSICN